MSIITTKQEIKFIPRPSGWKGNVEYEAQVVAVHDLYPAFEDAEPTARTYRGVIPFSGSSPDYAIDVSAWVPVGPNAPPEFIEAGYTGNLGRRGKDRYVTAISEGGALFCRAEGRSPEPVPCAYAIAHDPDGDTLTYSIDPSRWDGDKFEIDPGTSQLPNQGSRHLRAWRNLRCR